MQLFEIIKRSHSPISPLSPFDWIANDPKARTDTRSDPPRGASRLITLEAKYAINLSAFTFIKNLITSHKVTFLPFLSLTRSYNELQDWDSDNKQRVLAVNENRDKKNQQIIFCSVF